MSLETAEKLLNGEGLNHSSYVRALGLKDNIRNKKDTKEEYDKILKSYSDVIEKQGHDWFMIKAADGVVEEAITYPEAVELVDEIEELKRENKRLKQENAELRAIKSVEVKPIEEIRSWRYHKDVPEGKIFTMSEIKGLEAGWKDHPDKV